MIEKIKSFLLQCSRVWTVLKKPSIEEVKTISKISAIGILAVGFIGFVISIVINAFS
ncbi:MAG: protein translocase SEC61 complex subunit gamma [Candidatus Pacearchaeota archaeon]